MKRSRDGLSDFLPTVLEEAESLWKDFEVWARQNLNGFETSRGNKKTGGKTISFSFTKWKRHAGFPNDVDAYLDLLVVERTADVQGETMPDSPKLPLPSN